MKRLKKFLSSDYLFPVLIIVVLAASYGLQVRDLGYYLDDWIILEAYKMGGVERLANYTYAVARPLVYPYWLLGFSVAGTNPIAWQVWSLAWRAAAAIVIWMGWRKLLPTNRITTGAAALLFAIYPIFDQQASAVAFSSHWMVFTIWGLSFYCMLCAAEKPQKRVLFTILGLLFFALQAFPKEFFIGLEILRPFALWWMFKDQDGSIKKAAKWWVPWGAALATYLVWRLKFMPLPSKGDRNAPVVIQQLFTEPIKGIVSLVKMTTQSIIEGLAGTWYKAIDPTTFTLERTAEFASWVVAIGLFVMACVLIWRYKETESSENSGKTWLYALLFGGLFFLGGIAPGLSKGSYFTPLNPTSDRFAMAAMPGAALIITSLTWYLVRQQKARMVILSTMICLAVGFQFRVANTYRHSWEKQERLYWQLAWRAPDIEPNTAFLGNGALAIGMGRWATASALNLMYGDYWNTEEIEYWYVDLYKDDFAGREFPIDFGASQLNFTWEKDRSIVFQYEPGISACLWVLDESDASNPDLDPYVQKAVTMSNLSLVGEGGNPIDGSTMFGDEHSHDWWCYFYQKGALAAQLGDWDETLRQMQEAEVRGRTPYHSSEYMPFIKAAGAVGDWDKAMELSQKAAIMTGSTSHICTTWQYVEEINLVPADVQTTLINDYGCVDIEGATVE